MTKRILLTFFSAYFLMGCFLSLSAHPGGHYHKGDGSILNSWQLKNGQVIKGNFSMGKDDFIILEQQEGKMLKLAIADLSEQDQKLAQLKIKKFKKFNMDYQARLNTDNPTTQEWNFSYLLLSLFLLIICTSILYTGFLVIRRSEHLNRRIFAGIVGMFLLIVMAFACKKSAENIIATIPKTSPGFIDSAFTPYKPALSTNWDAKYFYVSSNGFPAHNMMVGITSWQQQVPIPQFYTGSNSWSIPLQPEYASTPMSTKTNFMKGAVAIAVNGIPIFNALNNRGEDSYLIGELDNWGGHCGKGDDYHYHAAPLHLSTTSGLLPIAFALDGFPVYGTKEPDGSAMQTLDTCHGHIGSNGVYHYHGTTNYPYVVGAMKGKVTTDPATPAPENQILPQAFASPLRPATSPLNGASITAFASVGTNNYLLTYKRGIKFGYVNYKWDIANKYTFIFTDTAGNVSTSVYQR